MRSISDATLAGKRVLVRVDFNVPLDDNRNVTDDTRIVGALPTIKHLIEQGAAVILMSHLGRPKGEVKPLMSLKPAADKLSEILGKPVKFVSECVGDAAVAETSNLAGGEIAVLENLRFHAEETSGDEGFAEQLSKHGDVYVNDAFGTAHRAHASTTIVAKFFQEKFAGFLLQKEVETASGVMSEPKRPFTAIMGGAKVSDKILLIQSLLDKVDNLLIGGGMAYTFLKAKGMPIGKSICEDEKLMLAASLLKSARAKGVTLLTPVDSVVADEFSETANTSIVLAKNHPDDMMGMDIGPETYKNWLPVIAESGTILWNGPMGVFEMKPFSAGTFAVAEAVVQATENGGFSLIGGGDSAAAVKKAGLADKVSYVSTGGGALLEMLEGKTLPGVAALD